MPQPAAKPAETTADLSGRQLRKHTRLIGGLTFVSRIGGLAREVVAGHYLGTGVVASAFTVAFTIPNLFRKLLGEGALSQAFIPLYAQARRNGKTQSGDTPEQFAAGSVKLLAVVLVLLTVAGELLLAGLLWAGVSDRLMLQFALVMLPYVLLVCGGAFLAAILQVHDRFGPPAFAPVLLNVVHIAIVVAGAAWLGLHGRDDPASGRVVGLQTRLAFALAVAVLVAGVLQVLVLLPALRAAGFRFRTRVPAWTADTRRMLRLSVPVALGAAVLQTSVLLDKAISYGLMAGPATTEATTQPVAAFSVLGQTVRYPLESGAPARLDKAQLLYQFPLGIFAIAIATAIFPSLSASAADTNKTAFKRHCRQGVLATLWEGVPASCGLVLVADPAVRLLFQHGQIDGHNAGLIVRSTVVYAAGIWAYSMLQVINRAYYALHDTKTPLVASGVNVAANLAVELPLLWWLGEPAMALGTLVSFSVQAAVMLWMLDRRVGGLGLGELVRPTAKILLAAAVMTGVLLVVRQTPWYRWPPGQTTWTGQLVGLTAVGAGVYLGVCRVLGVRTFGR